MTEQEIDDFEHDIQQAYSALMRIAESDDEDIPNVVQYCAGNQA